MLKKTFISSIIFVSTASPIFAKTTSYVGGGISAGGYTEASGFQGPSATLFGGMGQFVGQDSQFYLGGEANATVNHHSHHQTVYGLGASFLPGVMVTKSTMLYSRLGLASNYYAHPNRRVNMATVTGIGVQTNVAKNWDARIEYTSYGKNSGKQAGLGLLYKFN